MGLRHRIMLLVAIGLLIATVPLGVMGLIMVRAATDRVLEERLAMTRATAEHLNERLAQARGQLDYLGIRIGPLWSAENLAGVGTALAGAVPQMAMFSGGVFLTDRMGHLVIQEPAVPDLRLRPPDTLQLAAETLTTRRPVTSTLLSTVAGIPVVVAAVPVVDSNGSEMGAICGVIDLRKPTLQALIDGLALGYSGHAAIVGKDGKVLASTDAAERFTRNEHPEFFVRFIAQGRPLVGRTDEKDGPGEVHVMAFAPVASVPWGLGVGQNEQETFGPIRQLRDRIIVFELVVLVAALLFAWLDTGAVAAPLRALQDGAESIAGGNLARQIEVRRSDEIGTLAKAFETMRLRLLHSLEEIQRRARASQSLYEIGTEVLSLQDRDAVLRSIASRAVSLLHADVAVICLLDELGTTARISGAAGAAAALQDMTPFPIAGEIALDCLQCARVDGAYRNSRLAEPLTVGTRIVGALCVGTRAERTFSSEDREVLGGLANLAAMAVENARLQERVQSVAVLEERERIAREMHDGVGQVLGYVNTKAQAVKLLLDAGRTSEAYTQLAQLEQAAREVYADLREAILGLRTATSPERRLIPALQEYVTRFSELSGVATELVVEGDASRHAFGPATELHLIRIIQEALTNVRKHSMATHAWVRLGGDGGTVTIGVADDGLGFDPARLQPGGWPRFGLQTMRERAEAIGGTFTIRSRDGRGTEVEVRLPVQGREDADARVAGGRPSPVP